MKYLFFLALPVLFLCACTDEEKALDTIDVNKLDLNYPDSTERNVIDILDVSKMGKYPADTDPKEAYVHDICDCLSKVDFKFFVKIQRVIDAISVDTPMEALDKETEKMIQDNYSALGENTMLYMVCKQMYLYPEYYNIKDVEIGSDMIKELNGIFKEKCGGIAKATAVVDYYEMSITLKDSIRLARQMERNKNK